MRKIIIVITILMCLLLLPLNTFAITYGKVGSDTNFNGDVNVPSGSSYYKDGVELSVGSDKTEWVYPQDYATGTGTSGDPWAGNCLTDAYTAATAGDTIYLRAGYYTLESLLNIEGKMVNLIGDGIGKTFIVTSMNDSHAIRVIDDYVTLKGFTLDCDSQPLAEAGPDYIGIKLDTGNYITIEDIEVKNAGYAGFEYADIDYATINRIYTHDNNWMGFHSSHLQETQGRHNTFQNIYTWNHTHYGFDDGIPGTTPSDNTYDNIHAWNCGKDGINIYTMYGGQISNCSCTDCDEYGIYIFAHDLSVHDCEFNFNNSKGIYINDSTNVSLNNVISKNNLGTAAVFVESSTGIRFDNCQFYDDKETPVQDRAIYVEGTCSVDLIGCKLWPNEVDKIGIDGTLTLTSIDGVVDGYAAVAGDIQYFDGTNWIRLAKGTAGQVLEMNAGATAPEWDTDDTGAGGALGDLTDVGNGTPTNTYAIMGDGDSWESRALVEADISDLGTYLENVLEDTTPELGGELDAGDNNITDAGSISFTQELDNGSKDTHFSVDFATDQKQKATLTANTMTLTLDTTSVGVGNYLLKIVNGGLATLTWASESGSVYFPGGTDPALTASGTDIVALYFDGTNWYGMAGLDFK